MDEQQFKKIHELARNVLMMSRNTLLVKMRFLDLALSMFRYSPYLGTIGTDGKDLYYNPMHILVLFKNEREFCTRAYLHLVFHCVFRHMFVGEQINRRIWNLACDIAVENAIIELQIKSLSSAKEASEKFAISGLSFKKQMTAEKIYRFLSDQNLPESRLNELESLFCYDDHDLWYQKQEQPGKSGGDGNSEGQRENSGGQRTPSQAPQQQNDGQADPSSGGIGADDCSQRWKEISERMQEELETFAKQQGDTAGGMMQNLREVNREKYDYSAFLRKFAVQMEVMKINDDEFDYIFYTYGLNLYKKMPLIEPLEYKDAKRIREFVVAIDTSGSTSGELVQKFVQKTYNILKSTETFSDQINLHIIQCDAEIQEDAKITSQEEFDRYLKAMKLKGLGGTDFRPVFQYVDKLRKSGELKRMKGLIYFTDGYGDFPSKKPDYDTAFVFIEDNFNNPFVPPWAIKLILSSEEI